MSQHPPNDNTGDDPAAAHSGNKPADALIKLIFGWPFIGGLFLACCAGLWEWLGTTHKALYIIGLGFCICLFLVAHKIWGHWKSRFRYGLPTVLALCILGACHLIVMQMAPMGTSQPIATTDWKPPELPTNCSNILFSFGGTTLIFPIFLAQMGKYGTSIPVKDMPEDALKAFRESPDYSPRTRDVSFSAAFFVYFGENRIESPVRPLVISNRLYVEAQTPFTGQSRVVLMRDELDSTLPLLWDRNYNSNNFEVVNEAQRPILQITYKSANEVQVSGIFVIEGGDIYECFGDTPRLLALRIVADDGSPPQNMTLKEFEEAFKVNTRALITNAAYANQVPYQRAIFRYPSNRHLGELAK